MNSRMKMIAAIALIVTTCRFKYAFAPSCTAAEICRIRSLPAGARRTMAMRKKAKISPMAAHSMDNCTPESSRLRARKVMALARDKAHDSIKISDAGKAYLPRPEMSAAPSHFANDVVAVAVERSHFPSTYHRQIAIMVSAEGG